MPDLAGHGAMPNDWRSAPSSSCRARGRLRIGCACTLFGRAFQHEEHRGDRDQQNHEDVEFLAETPFTGSQHSAALPISETGPWRRAHDALARTDDELDIDDPVPPAIDAGISDEAGAARRLSWTRPPSGRSDA